MHKSASFKDRCTLFVEGANRLPSIFSRGQLIDASQFVLDLGLERVDEARIRRLAAAKCRYRRRSQCNRYDCSCLWYPPTPPGRPIRVVDRVAGEEIAEIQVMSCDGRPLRASDVTIFPGPGAGPSTKARFAKMLKRKAPAVEHIVPDLRERLTPTGAG